MEHKHSEGVGSGPQVVEGGSLKVEEHSGSSEHRLTVASPLHIPAINVTAGTPPLLALSDTAVVVEENEVMSDTTNDPPAGSNNATVILGNNIGLTETTSEQQQNIQQRHKRQGSERKSRSNVVRDIKIRRRAKSSERSDRPVSPRIPKSPSSEHLSRRSIDVSQLLAKQAPTRERSRFPELTTNKPFLSNDTASEVAVSSDSEDELAPSSSSLPRKKPENESVSLTSSRSSTCSMSSSTAAEERQPVSDQPPCVVGEQVMVDTPNGFKFGKVKFIGSTEFATGEWIGIALERQSGECFVMVSV